MAKIALRMTRGPTNACIDFHVDGDYATGTVQVSLNDSADYEGCRLCFFTLGGAEEADELVVLERPAGSVSQLTSLTAGTRKSLFVVDDRNGLGEGSVVVASSSDVALFLEAQQRADQEEATWQEQLRLQLEQLMSQEEKQEEVRERHDEVRERQDEVSGVAWISMEDLDQERDAIAGGSFKDVYRAQLLRTIARRIRGERS
mmetsp:Transcript_37158/g.93351  ORF Transcript_37158/g.93351 Transcript_37158/m.93351 type:complete len:202 (+) Transcript_37158:649-1254(+)